MIFQKKKSKKMDIIVENPKIDHVLHFIKVKCVKPPVFLKTHARIFG